MVFSKFLPFGRTIAYRDAQIFGKVDCTIYILIHSSTVLCFAQSEVECFVSLSCRRHTSHPQDALRHRRLTFACETLRCGKQKKPPYMGGFFVWWGKVDSNHRRRCQQIYSLPPLATREHSHIHFYKKMELVDGLEPPTC